MDLRVELKTVTSKLTLLSIQIDLILSRTLNNMKYTNSVSLHKLDLVLIILVQVCQVEKCNKTFAKCDLLLGDFLLKLKA